MSQEIGTGIFYESFQVRTHNISSHNFYDRETYAIVRLLPHDFNELSELQACAYDSLPDKELYLPRTDSRIHQVLQENSGFVIGAKSKDSRLIGARMVFFPAESPDNMGIELGFTGTKLSQVIHLEASVIHPTYRGRGVLTTLGEHVLHRLLQMPSWRYLTATVSYKNIPSLRDKFRFGMAIRKIEYINGYMRFLLAADLIKHQPDQLYSKIDVPLSDIPTQQELLATNFVGSDIRQNLNGEWVVHYHSTVPSRVLSNE